MILAAFRGNAGGHATAWIRSERLATEVDVLVWSDVMCGLVQGNAIRTVVCQDAYRLYWIRLVLIRF